VTTHETYEQLAVGHALCALEPEDEQAFLAHLRGCAACVLAVADHTGTLAHLAYGAPAADPPPSLLEGIRVGVVASGRAGAFPAPVSLEAARDRRRDRTVRATTALIGAAAALVLVAALVFVNRGLQSDKSDITAHDAQLRKAVSSLLTDQSSRVDLTGAGGSRAVAVVTGGTVSLVMQGLAVNDRSDSIYVLWERTRFGDVRAVGTFDVRSTDLAVVSNLRLPGAVGAVRSFIVTREQGRTAPPIAKGSPVVAGDA
jgi:hypothetical protein